MRNSIKSILLILPFCFDGFGQLLDQDCRPIPPPAQCQTIVAQIEEREDFFASEINRLTEQRVRNASERRQVANRIRSLRQQRDRELADLRNDLRQCRGQFNTVPQRQEAATPLNAVFNGNIRANTTDSRARGPFFKTIGVQLRFSRNRCVVEITSFPPIVFQTDPVPLRFTITVTQIGGGTGQFFPVSGQMNLPIRLKAAVPIFADSEASAALTTGNSVSINGAFNVMGSPLTRTNNAPLENCGQTINGTLIQCPITLAGTTVFEGGLLDDDEGSISITGNIIIPQPPPATGSVREQCLERCEREYDECRERRVQPPQQPPNCRAIRNRCEARCPR